MYVPVSDSSLDRVGFGGGMHQLKIISGRQSESFGCFADWVFQHDSDQSFCSHHILPFCQLEGHLVHDRLVPNIWRAGLAVHMV